MMRVAIFLAFLLTLQACVSPPRPLGQGRLQVIYSSNRQGEIEPCGCQVNQIGGLDRLFDLLQKERRKSEAPFQLLLDSGDTFFSTPQLLDSRKNVEILKAQVIADSYRKLGWDVVTPGERDFAAGLQTLNALRERSGAVFVASNLTDRSGRPLFLKSYIITRAGYRIGVTGVASPDAFQAVEGVDVSDPQRALRQEVTELRRQGASPIVVLSHLGLSMDREIAKVSGVDLVIGSHSIDVLAKPERVGSAPALIVQPQFQGQQVGLLDWTPSGWDVNGHRLVDLSKEYESPNEIRALMDRHREQVRQQALKSDSRIHVQRAKGGYVAHPFQCRTCHQAQHDFWEKTKHASAYLVLYAKNQHFDPQCVGCHTLGHRERQGFQAITQPLSVKGKRSKEPVVETLMKSVFSGVSPQKGVDSRLDPERFRKLHVSYTERVRALEDQNRVVANYLGVQCEHCHGIRAGHPDPRVHTTKKVSVESCRKCHQPPHAKEFDPSTFSRVACPLSGSH